MSHPAPDIQVGEVAGVRLFRIFPDGTLRSYSRVYTWTPGANAAACRRSGTPGHGPVPALGCKCGLWMYKDPVRCARMFRRELMPDPGVRGFGSFEPEQVGILGRALGWGRVLEGADGWRVEYARLDALLDVGQGIDLTPWAEVYDVPVVAAHMDWSLVRTGRLTALGEDVGRELRTGIRVDGKVLVVRVDTLAFIQLWQLPLGTQVEVRLDSESGDVVGVRVLTLDAEG